VEIHNVGVYRELGVRRVVNAWGQLTRLGGSVLSPRVRDAMEEANRQFVRMEELQEAAGKVVAEVTGAEAAFVTGGACAALALSAAACITGDDTEKMEALPDTREMKNEIIIMRDLRVKYDRCVTIPRATLVEVGDTSGVTAEQMEAAIGLKTAAIHFLAREEGPMSLREVVKIAKRNDVPVIVDAAGQVYPLEKFKEHIAAGADLVCHSSKYFLGPNSAGFLCGRRELVNAAAMQDFVSFEVAGRRAFGRPMKLDRQEIVALVVALREWMEMDHQARMEDYDRKVRSLLDKLEGVPHIEVTATPEGENLYSSVTVTVDDASAGKSTEEVVEALRDGDPRVEVPLREGKIFFSVRTLVEGDEQIIADRLEEILSSE
jgi:L-seryl-tRNA(Ser) seleniumtransferase